MGPEILFPLFPLCILHIAWRVLSWTKSPRPWLALPIAALIAGAILAGVAARIEPVFDLYSWIWIVYLFLFVPLLILRAIVRGVLYVIRLPKVPPPA